MKKIITMFQLQQGDRIPFGYGVAFVNFRGDIAICYPIPINLIVGWTRKIWFKIKHGPKPSEFEMKLSSAYQQGYQAGYQKGFKRGFEKAQKEDILDALDTLKKLIRYTRSFS